MLKYMYMYMLLLLLLGVCNAATAWAHRGEWLEAAFGAPERERFLRNSTSQLARGWWLDMTPQVEQSLFLSCKRKTTPCNGILDFMSPSTQGNDSRFGSSLNCRINSIIVISPHISWMSSWNAQPLERPCAGTQEISLPGLRKAMACQMPEAQGSSDPPCRTRSAVET